MNKLDRFFRQNTFHIPKRAGKPHFRRGIGLFLALMIVFFHLIIFEPVQAQSGAPTDPEVAVQVLTGVVDPGQFDLYLLEDLKAGETLSIHLNRVSGDLDPFMGLADQPLDAATLQARFIDRLLQVVDDGGDPLEQLPDIYKDFFVAWDDDSGAGYSALLEYVLPVDGDYRILVVSAPFSKTFGEYQLIVGRNSPAVLRDEVMPQGDAFVFPDPSTPMSSKRVQVVTIVLDEEKPEQILQIDRLRKGDVFYAWTETISAGSAPVLILQDYGGKPLRSSNLNADQSEAKLSYRVVEAGQGFTLKLMGGESQGTYRLVLGVNALEVMAGQGEATEMGVTADPFLVEIGIELEQITEINQTAENFSAVILFQMSWQDPRLAFSPDSCQCQAKTYRGLSFAQFADAEDILWPQFTIQNQQGHRFVQNQNVVVWPDGRAYYLERFTSEFQAPLFDFRKFPFDTQQLFIQVDSLLSDQWVSYVGLEEYSRIGTQLGEEQWVVTDSMIAVNHEESKDNFSLVFHVRRDAMYYVFRILVPILLIVIVAWMSFFMVDYAKRIDIASANLLVFVAFNFSISADLPRIGYLTFMDFIVLTTFLMSIVVVILNVFLKRLEISGRHEKTVQFDRFLIWIYPLIYITAGLCFYLFILR